MIYALKATAGQERVVAELLYTEVKNQGADIYSVFYSTNLKGYILVEADNPGTVADIAREVPNTRGLILRVKGDITTAGTVPIEELEDTLAPKKAVVKINKGDLVELISGPFKGEKARVARVDKEKDELTVELIEAAVPIPITVKGDDIKVLESREDGE